MRSGSTYRNSSNQKLHGEKGESLKRNQDFPVQFSHGLNHFDQIKREFNGGLLRLLLNVN